MSASYKGALIGGALGLYTALTGPSYTILYVGFMTITIGLIGWAIGRYLEMRAR